MPFETRHNDIKLIASSEFVEALAGLFDLGTPQAEKITLAKSFSTKQDRYELLDHNEGGTLVNALLGISVFPNISHNPIARELIRDFLAYAQQLVSWVRASVVHQAVDQEDLNIEVSRLFYIPQLVMLISACDESDLLEDCSPLKQLPRCIDELIRYDFDPIQTCKELLKRRAEQDLGEHSPATRMFFKHLNSLDPRSSTRPSTQRRELNEFNKELSHVLKEDVRRDLIEEMTGIYAAMMVLNQLHRLSSELQPQFFPSVIRELQIDLRASVAPMSPPRHLIANHKLFLYMLDRNNLKRLTATTSNTPPFRTLLENHASFTSTGLPSSLRDFLRDGMTRSWTKSRLLKVRGQLERCSSKPYFNGVTLFVFGLLAMSDEDWNARKHFENCLDAAGKWPLGPLGGQAALFVLGLKLAEEPSQPPAGWNPLLSVYLDGLPQEFTLQLASDEQESVEMYNLRKLIGLYNSFCWSLIGRTSSMMVNPFAKIDAYLQKIFDEIDQTGLDLTAENLAMISKKLTTKRDVQRVKSDFFGTSLNQWLTTKGFTEVDRAFPDPDMWQIVPAIARYMELRKELHDAISSASAAACSFA